MIFQPLPSIDLPTLTVPIPQQFDNQTKYPQNSSEYQPLSQYRGVAMKKVTKHSPQSFQYRRPVSPTSQDGGVSISN